MNDLGRNAGACSSRGLGSNTKMTQPHRIFAGIPLAAVETMISLLLNRACQWLRALLSKM